MPRGWDKEKLLVRDRFEPMTSETPGGRSIHLSYGELMELMEGYILGSYLTRVVHTAGTSNVAVVLCGERIKDGKF